MSFFCLLAMMIALIVRLTFLGKLSIYLDEAFSIQTAQRPPVDLLKRIARDNNPPLHYLLLSFWVRIFGTTAEATRLMSTLLNVLSIPLLMVIARRFFNDKVAVYAVSLFVFADLYIYYSQEARTYTLVSLLTLLSFYYLFSLSESGSWKHALLLGLTNYLLIMSHYGIYVLFPMQTLIMLLYLPRHPRMFGRYLVGQLGALMLFLPWYFYWQAHLKKSVTWVAEPSWEFVKYVLLRFAGTKFWLALFQWLILIGLPVTVAWQMWHGKRDLRRLLSLLLWGVGAMAVSVLMSHLYKPSFKENYVLFCLPAFLLLIAWIWSELPLNGTLKTVLFAIGVLYMSETAHYKYYRHRAWRETAQSLQEMKGENTLVMLGRHFYALQLAYCAYPEEFRDYTNTYKRLEQRNIFSVYSERRFKSLNPGQFEDFIVVSLKVNLEDKNYFPVKYMQEHYQEVGKSENGEILLHQFRGKKEISMNK